MGIALGDAEKHVAIADAELDDFDQGPDTGLVRLCNRHGDAGQETGERDTFLAGDGQGSGFRWLGGDRSG